MSKTLIVVDVQHDFVYGSLGSNEAQKLIPKIKAKIDDCRRKGYRIIFTMDTHDGDYFNTNEGKKLPIEHCRFKQKGWEIIPGLAEPSDTIVYKDKFGTLYWDKIELEDVEIIGFCTDICVISNAIIIKSLSEYFDVVVDSSCCCGTTLENHNKALDIMRQCHIDVI